LVLIGGDASTLLAVMADMEVVVAGRDPSTGLRVMLEGVLARTYGSVPSLLNSRAVEPGTSTIRLRVDMLMWQRCD